MNKYLKRGSKLSYFQRGWVLGSSIFQQAQQLYNKLLHTKFAVKTYNNSPLRNNVSFLFVPRPASSNLIATEEQNNLQQSKKNFTSRKTYV